MSVRLLSIVTLALTSLACRSRATVAMQCRFADDCADPLVCVGGYCREQCRTDRDCLGGHCVPSTTAAQSVCVSAGSRPICSRNTDCPAPLVCTPGGLCSPMCAGDRDCNTFNPAATCRPDGTCDLGVPGSDGGTDAGTDVAMCPATRCQLIAPQCGCDPGFACYGSTPADATCLLAGTLGDGATCVNPSDCAPGLVCNATNRGPRQCGRYCDRDDVCRNGGPGSFCRPLASDPALGACTTHCDVVNQTGCPSGSACDIGSPPNPAVSGTLCRGVGMGGQGQSCTALTDCQVGFTCTGRCERICNTARPTCPAGTTCTELVPSVTIGIVHIGSCS